MKKICCIIIAAILMMAALTVPAAAEKALESLAGFWYVSEVVVDGVAHTCVAEPEFEFNQYVMYIDPDGIVSTQEYSDPGPVVRFAKETENGLLILPDDLNKGEENIPLTAIGDSQIQFGKDPANCLIYNRFNNQQPLVGKYYLRSEINKTTHEGKEYPEREAEPGQDKRMIIEIYEDHTGKWYDELKPDQPPKDIYWEKMGYGLEYLLHVTDNERGAITLLSVYMTPDLIDITYRDTENKNVYRRLRE